VAGFIGSPKMNFLPASLVLEVHHADEAPIWRYWGPRLPDGTTPGAPLRDGRPLPSFMLDFDQPLTTAPTFGVGWFGQSALLAHRSGQQFAQAFSACTVEWVAPGSALVLHLADPWRRSRAPGHHARPRRATC
jgi:alpha-galactosidase